MFNKSLTLRTDNNHSGYVTIQCIHVIFTFTRAIRRFSVQVGERNIKTEPTSPATRAN